MSADILRPSVLDRTKTSQPGQPPLDGRSILDLLPETLLWKIFQRVPHASRDLLHFMLTCTQAMDYVLE